MEIERKYRVRSIPGDLNQYAVKQIEQGYLCTDPILRIRKIDQMYVLTYKKRQDTDNILSSAVLNDERELPLTEDAYAHLRGKTDHHMVTKKRYILPLEEGLKAELDIFEGRLAGLILAEVEFPDIAAANAFHPPAWMGEEVSGHKEYGNYHLSQIDSWKE